MVIKIIMRDTRLMPPPWLSWCRLPNSSTFNERAKFTQFQIGCFTNKTHAQCSDVTLCTRFYHRGVLLLRMGCAFSRASLVKDAQSVFLLQSHDDAP